MKTPSRSAAQPWVMVVASAALAVICTDDAAAITSQTPVDPIVQRSTTPAPAPDQREATEVPWWLGFDDSTLNVLTQSAALHAKRQSPGRPSVDEHAASQPGPDDAGASATTTTTTVQSRLVSAYVEAKVLSIRLATAQSLHLTTRRQLALASGTSPTPDAASSALASRLQRTEQVAVRLKSDLANRLATIAELTGIDPRAIQATLASTLAMTVPPHFSVAVPARLPASVVRRRRDVAAVESGLLRGGPSASLAQYDMAQHTQAMQGWIEPRPAQPVASAQAAAAPPSSSDAQTSETSALSGDESSPAGPVAVVARSKQEVARHLGMLIAHNQSASRAYEWTQRRRAEFQAARRRLELGEQPEFEVLERHILLLLETDRLAAALGDVAQCWIALNLSTAGGASMRDDIVSTAISPGSR